MLLWTLSLAAAISLEDIAAEIPGARSELRSCAENGCDRASAARAAWLIAVATYLRDGVADGELAATVKALDAGLFADFPDVLKESATEPMPWTNRVGGARTPIEVGENPLISARLEALQQQVDDRRPRMFVFGEGIGNREGVDRENRRLKTRSGRGDTWLYPDWMLCQQAELSAVVTWDPADDGGAVVTFDDEGEFRPMLWARDHETYIGGLPVIVTDPEGQVFVTEGEHQVAILGEDGVGPVLQVRADEREPLSVIEHARSCVADAWDQSPDALAPHFRRLAERLPDAPLYAIETAERIKDMRLWQWDGERVVEIDP